MSARTIESLHPTTWASIQMQSQERSREGFTFTNPVWTCGCSATKSGKVWLCQYHDGFDDGAWAVEDKDSGCTCGFGGMHDDVNPRCALNEGDDDE